MNNNSAARARRLAVSTVAEIDEDTRNLHSYAVIAIVLSALTVLGMWALNAFVPQGYGRGVVMVIAFIGLLVMATAALHPKFLFWAAGLGAIVEGLNDRDITQGSMQGVRVYFRVVSGALFYFTASAVILAIIPFTKAPSVFWGFALIIIAVSTLFAYLNVDTGKWKVRIVVTSVIILSLLLAAKLLLPEGVLQLGTSSYNALDRSAQRQADIINICSEDPANPICPSNVSSAGTPPETTPTPVEVYDVFVPGRGCSEPAQNTDSRFWINPFPKDARTGWPDLTLVITPRTGKGWVPYKDTMKSYSYIRWCNNTGRKTWMTVEVYKGRL